MKKQKSLHSPPMLMCERNWESFKDENRQSLIHRSLTLTIELSRIFCGINGEMQDAFIVRKMCFLMWWFQSFLGETVSLMFFDWSWRHQLLENERDRGSPTSISPSWGWGFWHAACDTTCIDVDAPHKCCGGTTF